MCNKNREIIEILGLHDESWSRGLARARAATIMEHEVVKVTCVAQSPERQMICILSVTEYISLAGERRSGGKRRELQSSTNPPKGDESLNNNT